MLNNTISYKSLMRIAGILLIIYGLYFVASALTAEMNNSDGSYGPVIFSDPGSTLNYIFFGGYPFANPIWPAPNVLGFFLPGVLFPGPLLYVGIGTLFLALASRRIGLMYWWLHIALWFISASLWSPLNLLNNTYDDFLPYILITLAISLVLLALYKPVTHFMRKYMLANGTMPAVHA